jgi:hypothetical protein
VLNRHGRIDKVVNVAHRPNVMAQMRWTREWIRETETPNTEFLFLISRR